MDLVTFLIQCLNSLQYGLLLFLVASGLTLIFGIMGVINLAHGSFYMIGAYMAYALAPVVAATFGGGFFATLMVGLVLAVIAGYVLEWAFFSFLYEREHLQQVLMTYGLILVFEELRSMLVGDDVHGVQPPAILSGTLPLSDLMTYPVYRLFISAVCLLLALFTLAYGLAANLLPRGAAVWLALAFLLQQAYMLARVWVRLLFYASQTRLYESLAAPAPAPAAVPVKPDLYTEE